MNLLEATQILKEQATSSSRKQNAQYRKASEVIFNQITTLLKKQSHLDDIKNQAYLRFYKKLSNPTIPLSFSTSKEVSGYLRRIIANLQYDSYRKKNREEKTQEEFKQEILQQEKTDPEKLILEKEKRRLLQKQLFDEKGLLQRCLKDAVRGIRKDSARNIIETITNILKKKLEEKSREEIAHSYSIARNTLDQRISRAIKSFLEALDGENCQNFHPNEREIIKKIIEVLRR